MSATAAAGSDSYIQMPASSEDLLGFALAREPKDTQVFLQLDAILWEETTKPGDKYYYGFALNLHCEALKKYDVVLSDSTGKNSWFTSVELHCCTLLTWERIPEAARSKLRSEVDGLFVTTVGQEEEWVPWMHGEEEGSSGGHAASGAGAASSGTGAAASGASAAASRKRVSPETRAGHGPFKIILLEPVRGGDKQTTPAKQLGVSSPSERTRTPRGIGRKGAPTSLDFFMLYLNTTEADVQEFYAQFTTKPPILTWPSSPEFTTAYGEDGSGYKALDSGEGLPRGKRTFLHCLSMHAEAYRLHKLVLDFIAEDRAAITPADVLGFIGITLRMPCVAQSSIDQYWAAEGGDHIIKRTMSRRRYKLIRQCLHFYDYDSVVKDPAGSAERAERLGGRKVWELQLWLNAAFGAVWDLSDAAVVDEHMCNIRAFCQVRMPQKPVRTGIKIFCLNDSLPGHPYCFRFVVYTGADSWARLPVPGSTANVKLIRYLAFTFAARSLTLKRSQQQCVCILDNYFTGNNTVLELSRPVRSGEYEHLRYQGRVSTVGTVRLNRIGKEASEAFARHALPQKGKKGLRKRGSPMAAVFCDAEKWEEGVVDLVGKSAEEMKKGLSEARSSSSGSAPKSIRLVVWGIQDPKTFWLGSTLNGPRPAGGLVQFTTRNGADVEEWYGPSHLDIYKRLMGGTDRMDQKLALFSHFHRSVRWEVRLFECLIGMASLNASILYSASTKKCPLDKAKPSRCFQRGWRDDLSIRLCERARPTQPQSSRRTDVAGKGGSEMEGVVVQLVFPNGAALQKGVGAKRKVCREEKQRGRAQCGKRTALWCATCSKNICQCCGSAHKCENK
jgi:hypothetical protein